MPQFTEQAGGLFYSEKTMIRWLVLVAGLVGATGVALGAYGAHGLEAQLLKQGLSAEEVTKKLTTCEIAVRYHLIHAVALLALAMAPASYAPRQRSMAALLFIAGLVMFSGILYAKALVSLKGWDLVVPFGGLSFILGWVTIAALGLRRSSAL